MGVIQHLTKKISGSKQMLYPVTKTKCVYDDNNDRLDSILAKINTSKSNTGHTHDDRYYTETEVDSKLDDMRDSFQGGVDQIYNACVSAGSTPTSKSIDDVTKAIADISFLKLISTDGNSPVISAHANEDLFALKVSGMIHTGKVKKVSFSVQQSEGEAFTQTVTFKMNGSERDTYQVGNVYTIYPNNYSCPIGASVEILIELLIDRASAISIESIKLIDYELE